MISVVGYLSISTNGKYDSGQINKD